MPPNDLKNLKDDIITITKKKSSMKDKGKKIILNVSQPENKISYNNKMSNENGNKTDRQYYDHINLQHIKYLLTLSDDELFGPPIKKDGKKYSPDKIKKYRLGVRRWFATMINSKNKKHARNYKMKGCNRYYPIGNGVSYCEANIRNFVCADFCRDYDMSNCHPPLILHLLKVNKFPHTFLEDMVNRRDELCEEYGITKHDILAKFNQDKPQAFSEDCSIVNEAIKEWCKQKKKII